MRKGVLAALFVALGSIGFAQRADVSLIAGGAFGADQAGLPDSSGCNPIIQPHCFFQVFTTNGGSFALEATPAVRLLHFAPVSLSLEVPFVFVPSRHTNGSTNTIVIPPNGSFGGSAVFITPGIRAKVFASAPVSPWISAGGGWSRISFDTSDSSVLAGHSNSRGSGTPEAALGVDIRTGLKALLIRAEVRAYWPETPFQQFVVSPKRPRQILAGGGVVWAF